MMCGLNRNLELIAFEAVTEEQPGATNGTVELTPVHQAAMAVETSSAAIASSPVQRASATISPVVLFILSPLATLFVARRRRADRAGVNLKPMPTTAVEFDKLDFHLQMLGVQTFVGGTLLLAGVLMFVVAAGACWDIDQVAKPRLDGLTVQQNVRYSRSARRAGERSRR